MRTPEEVFNSIHGEGAFERYRPKYQEKYRKKYKNITDALEPEEEIFFCIPIFHIRVHEENKKDWSGVYCHRLGVAAFTNKRRVIAYDVDRWFGKQGLFGIWTIPEIKSMYIAKDNSGYVDYIYIPCEGGMIDIFYEKDTLHKSFPRLVNAFAAQGWIRMENPNNKIL